MSELDKAEKVVGRADRVVNQAVEIANWIEQMERDKDLLLRMVSDKQKVIDMLELKAEFEKSVRLSQEKKSDTSLLFMFLFLCLTAVSIAYAILNCQ